MVLKEEKEYKWSVHMNEYGHIYFRGEKPDGRVMWLNSIIFETNEEEEKLETELKQQIKPADSVSAK